MKEDNDILVLRNIHIHTSLLPQQQWTEGSTYGAMRKMQFPLLVEITAEIIQWILISNIYLCDNRFIFNYMTSSDRAELNKSIRNVLHTTNTDYCGYF